MSASGEDSHDLPHDMSNLSDSAQTEAMPSEGAASEKKKYGCSHYERRCAYVVRTFCNCTSYFTVLCKN